MNLPINTNSGESTMSSLELRDVINTARISAGEKQIRNDQFLVRVEDELEGELSVAKKMVNPTGGRPQKYYDLTIEQCTLVGMRESKGVRRQVVAKLKEKEQPRQLSKAEMALMVIGDLQNEVEQQKLALEQATAERDQALKTKSQISSRREAVAMGRLSAAMKKVRKLEGMNTDEATVTAVEKALGKKLGKQAFRPLKNWCAYQGVTASDVPCPRYKSVKAWPAGAWLECYGVDLAELFGKEGAA